MKEDEGRKMTMDSGEIAEPAATEKKFFAMYKSLGGSSDEAEYRKRLKSFFLHTLNTTMGYDPEICGLPPTATEAEKGYRFYDSREEAIQAFMEAEQISRAEFGLIFSSVDSVHAYT